jgi:glycine cleavage system H protein
MNTPKDLKFTKTHEWVKADGDTVLIGITDFAQAQLSDLTYVELPSAGDVVAAQDEVAVVESVKAASDIYAPLAGEIIEVNEALADQPELINNDPYGEGWFFKLKPANASDVDAMLSADQYDELLPDED